MIILVLVLLVALIINLYFQDIEIESKWNELDELKLNILEKIAKDKEEDKERERHEKALRSIILYEAKEQYKKPFKIDKKGNVEYIKFEELKNDN